MYYPSLPGGLASSSCQNKPSRKKINKQLMTSSRKSSAASPAGERSLLRRLKRPRLRPSCRRVPRGTETLGFTGRCPEARPTWCSVPASSSPPWLPVTLREICWCPVAEPDWFCFHAFLHIIPCPLGCLCSFHFYWKFWILQSTL